MNRRRANDLSGCSRDRGTAAEIVEVGDLLFGGESRAILRYCGDTDSTPA